MSDEEECEFCRDHPQHGRWDKIQQDAKDGKVTFEFYGTSPEERKRADDDLLKLIGETGLTKILEELKRLKTEDLEEYEEDLEEYKKPQ